jgi:hypothetical protein
LCFEAEGYSYFPFNNEIRKEIRLRDRLRKNVFKFGRESDTLKYKKQRNKKKAKENFESTGK